LSDQLFIDDSQHIKGLLEIIKTERLQQLLADLLVLVYLHRVGGNTTDVYQVIAEWYMGSVSGIFWANVAIFCTIWPSKLRSLGSNIPYRDASTSSSSVGRISERQFYG
jgi:hypothetical protein